MPTATQPNLTQRALGARSRQRAQSRRDDLIERFRRLAGAELGGLSALARQAIEAELAGTPLSSAYLRTEVAQACRSMPTAQGTLTARALESSRQTAAGHRRGELAERLGRLREAKLTGLSGRVLEQMEAELVGALPAPSADLRSDHLVCAPAPGARRGSHHARPIGGPRPTVWQLSEPNPSVSDMRIQPPSAVRLSLPIQPRFRVDREAGELRQLALLTGGREAEGHGIYIDERTLGTAHEVVRARGGRLRAAIRHPSILDLLKTSGDRVLEVPGFFSDIELRGNQLVAGRMQFYDSFRESQPDNFRLLLEMAEKTPELFGLSIEPWGYVVFVADDDAGTEYSEKPDAETHGEEIPLRYGGMPALRVTKLSVAAFVDEPAANDGLFAAFSRMLGGGRDLKRLRTLVDGFFSWGEANASNTGTTKNAN